MFNNFSTDMFSRMIEAFRTFLYLHSSVFITNNKVRFPFPGCKQIISIRHTNTRWQSFWALWTVYITRWTQILFIFTCKYNIQYLLLLMTTIVIISSYYFSCPKQQILVTCIICLLISITVFLILCNICLDYSYQFPSRLSTVKLVFNSQLQDKENITT